MAMMLGLYEHCNGCNYHNYKLYTFIVNILKTKHHCITTQSNLTANKLNLGDTWRDPTTLPDLQLALNYHHVSTIFYSYKFTKWIN